MRLRCAATSSLFIRAIIEQYSGYILNLTMANTYTQLGIHIVTGVKYRQALIDPEWRIRLERYIVEIIEKRKHKVLKIYAMPDHIHVFVSLHPADAISDLVGAWKSSSSSFIVEHFNKEFEWQRGYGAFSVSKKGWPAVKYYIGNQEQHHGIASFREEYVEMLDEQEVEYYERYIFDDVFLG